MVNHTFGRFQRFFSGLAILLIVLVFSFGFLPTAFAQSPARPVRVGVYQNPPKIFLDNGMASGLYADVLNYIAQEENWDITYVSGTFEEGLGRLAAGQIDIMVDVAVSEEREGDYDLTKETVLSSWGVVYVRRDSDIDSIQDLDGKTIAILASSVYADAPNGFNQYVRAFNLDIDFVEQSEYGGVFMLLSEGKVDAAIVSRISGLEAERNYPNILASDIIFSPTELRFALTKNDPDNEYLISRLDYWVERLRDGHDGVYDQILAKYNLRSLAPQVEVVPPWVFPTAAGAAVFLIASWILILFLRHARRLALLQVAEGEVQFHSIVAAMDEGVVLQKKSGELMVMNPAAERILKIQAADYLGKDWATAAQHFRAIREDGSVFPDEDQPAALTLQTGKPQNGVVIGLQAPDSDVIWLSVNSEPLVSAGKSEPYAVLYTFRDITQQKKLEQHNQEVDELKSKFIRIVSHQLRTPLGVIRWNLESLLENLPVGLSKQQRELLASTHAEDVKIINRLSDLLEIMHIEEEKLSLKTTAVDIGQLIQSVCEAKMPAAKEKHLTFKIEAPQEPLPHVKIDEAKIRSVVERLVDNAITYTAKGRVDVRFSAEAGKIRFEVADTGIGIPSAEQHLVFDKFFRGAKAPLIAPNSFGLSLFIAKNYIRLHRGKIGFSSKDNEGSIFWFELPGSKEKKGDK